MKHLTVFNSHGTPIEQQERVTDFSLGHWNMGPLKEMGVVIISTALSRKTDPPILKKFEMTSRAFQREEYLLVIWK